MKKLSQNLFMICSVLYWMSQITFAQATKPEFKEGSELTYNVDFNGTKYDLVITLRKLDIRGSRQQVKMDWYYSTVPQQIGTMTMGGQAIDESYNLYYSLQPGESRELKGNLLMIVGRPPFRKLQDGKNASMIVSWLGKAKFVPKPQPEDSKFQLDGHDVDVIYAESEDGAQKIWILNDEDFPLIMKIVSGQTLTLGAVKAPVANG